MRSFAAVAAWSVLTVALGAQEMPKPDAVLARMRLANAWFMQEWPNPGKSIVTNRERPSNIWTRAVYYEGLMALYALDQNASYRDYAVKWGEAHKWGMRSGPRTRNADDQCCGQTYLELHRIDPKPERIRDIKESIDAMVASPKEDDWNWIDAIQMAMPVFAKFAALTQDPKYLEKAHAIYTYTKTKHGGNGLYNPADKLWWRDKDFVPPYKEPNGENCYWSRGNGWVFAALARVLEVLPADAAHRAEYERDLKDMAGALAAAQRADGFWNCSLHDPKNFGGKETSGTALFTFGMAWGIRHGLLPATKYRPIVIKAWNALANEAVHPNGTLGYVQGTGKEPKDGQPTSYDSKPDFTDYGLGCFLLAGSEVYRLAGDVSPAQPVIPDRTFKLTDFGAVPDGKTLNTTAFKRAVEAVDQAGGGTLIVPAGKYLTGPVDLCSAINLRIEAGATILFSPKFEDYGTSPRYRPLLLTSGAHDVKISGAGTINGHGEAWWDAAEAFKIAANAKKARSNTMPRPNLVGFDRCQRVRVEGITLTASPKFNLVPSRCQDVTIEGITILNPYHAAPNTDGIDPSLCQRVLIAHCHIDTDDDCIAIKSGGAAGEGVSDVLITDCTFLHGHGCSFGSETSGGGRRVTVRNCTFENTDIGVRFKSDRTRGGLVEDIVYENLTMKNVGQAIVITSYYPDRDIPKPGQHVAPQPVGPTTPKWTRITIRNVTAVGCTKSAGMIMGLPESPATDITLDNVSIEAPVGLRLGYAKNLTLKKVSVKAARGEALLIEDTVEALKRVD